MIGAGGQAGQGDAANLLKPALARGELRTIAATTWAEYKKYFEKDAALARRFQVVKVEEPDEDRAIRMMRGITAILEKHHGVRILDEAVESAVKLSHRYIPARQLPDKSVSLLDTACAGWRSARTRFPPPSRTAAARSTTSGSRSASSTAKARPSTQHAERMAEVQKALDEAQARLAALEARWEDERKRVEEIRGLAKSIEARYLEEKKPTANRLRQRRRPAVPALRRAGRHAGRSASPRSTPCALSRASRRSCRSRSTRRPSPRWSPAGRASPSARCSPTRSRPCSISDQAGGARHRPVARPGGDRPADPDRARQPDRPPAADRRVPPGRPQRRRQDRDRAGPGRYALRRRAEPDHDQHVGVPGGAHGLQPQGLAARLRRLRRGGRADRGRAPPALQRRAARRGREGPSRRPGAVLPGLRQGDARGRRGARDRLQEHGDPADLQRRHRHDPQALQGPRHDARRPRPWPRRSAPTCSRPSPSAASRSSSRRSSAG